MNTRKFLLLGLIWILLMGSLIHYSVIAQEEETETETEDSERSVSVERSDYAVSIESSSEQEEQEDAIEIEIDISGGGEFRMEYYSESTSTEIETAIELELIELVEFDDGNGNGVYDGEDTDELLQTYNFNDVGYAPISYTTNELDSGVTEHVISFQTTDGIFQTIIHIVGSFANIDGVDLQPTSLKIDYIINNFNFTSDTSKIALFSAVETSTEVETESDDDGDGQIEEDEEAVVQQTDGAYAFYSWKNTAEVDGAPTDVLTSYAEQDGGYQELYFNYEQGQTIIHDPKLGISTTAGSGSNFLDFSHTLIVVMTISMTALFVRTRKA